MSQSRTRWAVEVRDLLGLIPRRSAAVIALLYFARLTERQVCLQTGLSAADMRRAHALGMSELGRLLQARAGELI